MRLEQVVRRGALVGWDWMRGGPCEGFLALGSWLLFLSLRY